MGPLVDGGEEEGGGDGAVPTGAEALKRGGGPCNGGKGLLQREGGTA